MQDRQTETVDIAIRELIATLPRDRIESHLQDDTLGPETLQCNLNRHGIIPKSTIKRREIGVTVYPFE